MLGYTPPEAYGVNDTTDTTDTTPQQQKDFEAEAWLSLAGEEVSILGKNDTTALAVLHTDGYVKYLVDANGVSSLLVASGAGFLRVKVHTLGDVFENYDALGAYPCPKLKSHNSN